MWTGFCLRRQSFTTTECSTRLCIFGQCPTSTRQHWPMRADTSLNRCSVEFRGSKWKYMCLSGFGYIFDFIVILIIIFFYYDFYSPIFFTSSRSYVLVLVFVCERSLQCVWVIPILWETTYEERNMKGKRRDRRGAKLEQTEFGPINIVINNLLFYYDNLMQRHE